MAPKPPAKKPALPKPTAKITKAVGKVAHGTQPAEPQKVKTTDWERIELDYRAGIKTLRQIADEHGISHVAINKRAKRDDWTRDLSARTKANAVELATPDALDRAGFVYVIYLKDTAGECFYKIGMSASFSARFDAHQCASPFPICVACAYFVGNMRAEERALHNIFSSARVRGEWFCLGEEDLGLIAQRAKLV